MIPARTSRELGVAFAILAHCLLAWYLCCIVTNQRMICKIFLRKFSLIFVRHCACVESACGEVVVCISFWATLRTLRKPSIAWSWRQKVSELRTVDRWHKSVVMAEQLWFLCLRCVRWETGQRFLLIEAGSLLTDLGVQKISFWDTYRWGDEFFRLICDIISCLTPSLGVVQVDRLSYGQQEEDVSERLKLDLISYRTP